MPEGSLRQVDRTPRPRKWQVSLSAAFLIVLALASFFAVARYSAFTAFMTLWMLFPLTVAAVLRASLFRCPLVSRDLSRVGNHAPDRRLRGRFLRPLQFLGLYQPQESVSLAPAAATALISTLTLVALWPINREVGLELALATVRPLEQTREFAISSVLQAFSSGDYWVRLWQWELWAVSRWWILFGAIVLLWLAVSSAAQRRFNRERALQTVARYLAFAPWLIVLEMAFLIGVFIEAPFTVPEPSTGFVVGIFSWDLWHWDCWLDRLWLIRGALPTLIVGCVFFVQVLRWPWPAGAVVAVLLIPLALMLSIAGTVAYSYGFPPLF